jgi:hypothetical protein
VGLVVTFALGQKILHYHYHSHQVSAHIFLGTGTTWSMMFAVSPIITTDFTTTQR